tara:strand:+ start:382 stop:711 length:330 start_codon:yes stop_codon:yes gene_type:complete
MGHFTDVLNRIAFEHKVPPEHITQKTRKKDIVNLRYLVALELKEKHKYTQNRIAEMFGVEHTNISHLLRRGWVEIKNPIVGKKRLHNPNAMLPCYQCETMTEGKCSHGI